MAFTSTAPVEPRCPNIRWCYNKDMSNKQIVADLMERLPENASLLDIAREIEFVAGVREGFAQLDRGEGVPLEDVEKQLPSWISK